MVHAMSQLVVVVAVVVAVVMVFFLGLGVKAEEFRPRFELQRDPARRTAEVKPHMGVEDLKYREDSYVYDATQLQTNSFATRIQADSSATEGKKYNAAQPNYVYDATKTGTTAANARAEYVYDATEGFQNRFATLPPEAVGKRKTSTPGSTTKFDYGGGQAEYVYDARSQASPRDFAYRFSAAGHGGRPVNTFGDNSYHTDNPADDAVYSQFDLQNSQSTDDPTVSYGSTSPVFASRSGNQHNAPGGHGGCANMYWAEHVKHWPAFFNVRTEVAQAFGTQAGRVYGTTTLLQALYDNRADGYSQLLSHGVASLMNAYTKPDFPLRHDAVIEQFLAALPSRLAAGVQGQKFQNANHARGTDQCSD